MTADQSSAFPAHQDDQPGMTQLAYFAAHAPFSLDDVPVTKPGDPAPIDLTPEERMNLLVDMRYDYARKMVKRARRVE